MQKVAKGQRLSIEKDLSSKTCIAAFKWDQAAASGYSLDTSVMMLSERGKLEKEAHFIFYNNLASADGSVKMDANPLSGYKNSTKIQLDLIPADVSRLLFVITIDNGEELNQRFENIRNLTCEILDESRNIIYQYEVEGLTKETAVIIGELYKRNNEWKFQATGSGFNSGLAALLKEYGSEAVQVQEEASPPPKITEPTRQSSPSGSFAPPTIATPPTPGQPKVSKTPAGNKEFLNIYNKRAAVVKSLVNTAGLTGQHVSFALALDLSVSMSMMLKSGYVQDLLDLLMPFAMEFENNGMIDVIPFNDEAVIHKTGLSFATREDFVNKEILFNYYLSGTRYAPVIDKISEKYNLANKKTGTAYVLFLTDGDCEDPAETEQALRKAASKGIFWKFIALEGNKNNYNFLNRLGSVSPESTDFYHLKSIRHIDENEFYRNLLGRFDSWIRS